MFPIAFEQLSCSPSHLFLSSIVYRPCLYMSLICAAADKVHSFIYQNIIIIIIKCIRQLMRERERKRECNEFAERAVAGGGGRSICYCSINKDTHKTT